MDGWLRGASTGESLPGWGRSAPPALSRDAASEGIGGGGARALAGRLSRPARHAVHPAVCRRPGARASLPLPLLPRQEPACDPHGSADGFGAGRRVHHLRVLCVRCRLWRVREAPTRQSTHDAAAPDGAGCGRPPCCALHLHDDLPSEPQLHHVRASAHHWDCQNCHRLRRRHVRSDALHDLRAPHPATLLCLGCRAGDSRPRHFHGRSRRQPGWRRSCVAHRLHSLRSLRPGLRPERRSCDRRSNAAGLPAAGSPGC
mmetsp:Transcript_22570/g.85515  ORF Transcript_22570/g.85515 Transcript_22570/m.85515 type:complete len:258 (+) Transcript_22570:5275-6048(+)